MANQASQLYIENVPAEKNLLGKINEHLAQGNQNGWKLVTVVQERVGVLASGMMFYFFWEKPTE